MSLLYLLSALLIVQLALAQSQPPPGPFSCTNATMDPKSSKSTEAHPTTATDPVSITCTSLSPLKSVKCFRQGRKGIKEEWPGQLSEDKRSAVINFGLLNVTAVGVYVCNFTTTGGSPNVATAAIYLRGLVHVIDSKLRVDVSEDKPFVLKASGLTVVRGESVVNITCPVIGHPAPYIVWSKDGVEIGGGDDHIVVKEGEQRVEIKDVGDKQAGTYSCRATNSIHRNGTIEVNYVELTRELRVKSELAWVWPLIVIIVIVVLLVLIIIIFECKEKHDADKGHMITTEPDNDED